MIKLVINLAIVVGLFILSQFMYVLPIHATAFFVTIAAVIVADLHALLWIFGGITLLPKWRMEKLHQFVSFGLLVLITSGLILFLPVRYFLLYETAFQIKMLFVSALLVNSLFIHKHLGVASARMFTELSNTERFKLLSSGAVSTLCWAGTFVAAQFLGL